MPNLIKKSWTLSNPYLCRIIFKTYNLYVQHHLFVINILKINEVSLTKSNKDFKTGIFSNDLCDMILARYRLRDLGVHIEL